jgi:hypothetical protein
VSSESHLQAEVTYGHSGVSCESCDSIVEVASREDGVEESEAGGRVAERVDLLGYDGTYDAL